MKKVKRAERKPFLKKSCLNGEMKRFKGLEPEKQRALRRMVPDGGAGLLETRRNKEEKENDDSFEV